MRRTPTQDPSTNTHPPLTPHHTTNAGLSRAMASYLPQEHLVGLGAGSHRVPGLVLSLSLALVYISQPRLTDTPVQF